MSPDVQCVETQKYYAYKLKGKNFAEIQREGKRRIFVDMKFDDVVDPKGICERMEKGKNATGKVEIKKHNSDVNQIMEIIKQSFNSLMIKLEAQG